MKKGTEFTVKDEKEIFELVSPRSLPSDSIVKARKESCLVSLDALLFADNGSLQSYIIAWPAVPLCKLRHFYTIATKRLD